MQLRDYQQACHDSILEKWRTHQSTLAVLATGLGKTIIFAHIIKSMQPKRALVLAHRAELIWQAVEKIRLATGLVCDVEMADYSSHSGLFTRSPVIVGTVQTLNSRARITKFRPNDFGVVIIDEAHHSTSPTYRRIIEHFKQNPDIRILGVTATPDRADNEALGQVFEETAFDYDILQGVDNGWLVDVSQFFFPIESLDFSHVRTTAGDLNGADLARVMEAEENIQGIIQPTLEVMHELPRHSLTPIAVGDWRTFLAGHPSGRTIVFTASVVQAETCCDILNRAVPGIAEWVCGDTNKEERKEILKRFAGGKTRIVCNCGVLTEGFDNPGVEIIVMARPTKSRSLYAQMVGRSTRPLPNVVDPWATKEERKKAISDSPKKFCRIVDFVGNSGRHRLMTSYDILAGKISPEIIDRAIKACQKNEKGKFVCKHLTNEEEAARKEKERRADSNRKSEEERKARLIAKVQYGIREVNPFGRDKGPVQQHHLDWQGERVPTEKMRRILSSRNYNPDRYNFKQALAIIGKIAEKEGWNKKK